MYNSGEEAAAGDLLVFPEGDLLFRFYFEAENLLGPLSVSKARPRSPVRVSCAG